MGDINSKQFVDSLQGSAVVVNQKDDIASNKSNIVVMNPDIHLHHANSTNNDVRIKKLEEEVKRKQKEVDIAKRLIESLVKRVQRHVAEGVINEKLAREREDLIKNQHEIIVGITQSNQQPFTQRASWIRNQMENEPMNRLDVPVPQEASRKRKKRNKKNSNHNTNTYHYNNDYPNTMRHTHGLRSRSESENNYGNDTMDFWEWNGTEWFNKKTKTDQISKNTEQVSQLSSGEQKNKNSVQFQRPNAVYERASIASSTPQHSENCDVTSTEHNMEMNLTHLSQQEGARAIIAPLSTVPNISISFDETEIHNAKRIKF